MALTNRQVAAMFENIADLLEIKGETVFRVLSYRRASETLNDLPRDLQAYIDDGSITDIPGVGKAIAEKIEELLTTGKLDFYERLKTDVPESLLDIIRLNGVGPKKARLFWEQLNITNVTELEQAARAGKLASLPRMGAKSEQKILDAIEAMSRRSGRTPLGVAREAAQQILSRLMELPQSQKGVIAGSIRRGRTTIGDVDLLIASDKPAPIMETFVNSASIARVLGHGPTKSSIELDNGLQVDLRVLEPARWGTALQYFTGSQAHNVRIREIALAHGYSLNEHALRPVDADGNLEAESEYRYCAMEEEVYETIGLAWIPPEIREDSGEIEAAKTNKLPRLIVQEDIISDLHMHTTWSDGRLSIREMAEEARARGRKFIAITDHSQSSAVANGMSVERLLAQREEIQHANMEMGDDFHILHGVELDIKADATLDYPDEILAQLDIVVASLHFALTQDRAQITKRLLAAIQNPHVDIIGHPTARLIGVREPVDVDMDTVFEAALVHNTALEINCNPERLDLDAQYVRRAVELGIPLAINTDAHRATGMDKLEYGILTARRGWTTPECVINTWPYEQLRQWLLERS